MVRTLSSADKFNVWHTGSLDGTSTMFVRRHDGFCWAVLFNSRTGFNPETMKFDVTPSTAIDGARFIRRSMRCAVADVIPVAITQERGRYVRSNLASNRAGSSCSAF